MESVSQIEIDEAVIQAVDALSREELVSFRKVRPMQLDHYMKVQRAWVMDDIYYLGCEIHHKPTAEQIAERILNGLNSDRFRAFYALRHPDKVEQPGQVS